MIYVIEGSNKVGKSTGLSYVAKRPNCLVINSRYINFAMVDREQESYISALTTLDCISDLSTQGMHIFIDRFHLSELVYGKMYRKYINKRMYAIDEILAGRNDVALWLVVSGYSHVPAQVVEDKQLFEIQDKMICAFEESKIRNKIIISSDKFVTGNFRNYMKDVKR